jgi:hypothetical protein
MGGVTLTFPGSEGISASEIVFDEVTGLAAIMKLFERDKDESVATHVLRAPMMALRQPDAALAYPKDTVLSPRLFLRNSGTSNLQISIAVDWRSPNSTGTYKYPALNLTSNQLRAVDLGVLQDSGAIPKDANWGNVTLSYIGKSADLVPVAVSYDSKQRYGLQSPFTEGTNRMFKGGMWHVDSTHNSLITTGNGGSETTKAQLSLFYNGGKSQYRLEKVLAPGQQLLLDVGQLIRNQEPDSDGNVIPPETMTGSYELRDLDHPAVGLLYEGKLTIDKTYGHASYGCGTCCGLYNPKLTPNPYSGPASVYNQDYYLAEEQCGGGWDDFTGSAYSWQSTNTAVATLPTSMLHTVAPGTATGSAQNLLQATHPAPRCPQAVMGGYQPVTVCPNSTTVAELDPYSVALLFPTIETGIGAIATMVVAPSTPNNTAISEAFSPVSNSCPTTPPWPASLCPVPGPPFQVGQGAQGGVSINGVVYNFGPFYPGTPNTFYDQHTVTWTGSLLDSTGTRTCTATCTQTYSCSGVPVGSHTVTVTFIKAQVNGTNVTDTEFSKQ